MEAEDAVCTETMKDAAVADVVEEAGDRGVAAGGAGGGLRVAIHLRSRDIGWPEEID